MRELCMIKVFVLFHIQVYVFPRGGGRAKNTPPPPKKKQMVNNLLETLFIAWGPAGWELTVTEKQHNSAKLVKCPVLREDLCSHTKGFHWSVKVNDKHDFDENCNTTKVTKMSFYI